MIGMLMLGAHSCKAPPASDWGGGRGWPHQDRNPTQALHHPAGIGTCQQPCLATRFPWSHMRAWHADAGVRVRHVWGRPARHTAFAQWRRSPACHGCCPARCWGAGQQPELRERARDLHSPRGPRRGSSHCAVVLRYQSGFAVHALSSQQELPWIAPVVWLPGGFWAVQTATCHSVSIPSVHTARCTAVAPAELPNQKGTCVLLAPWAAHGAQQQCSDCLGGVADRPRLPTKAVHAFCRRG